MSFPLIDQLKLNASELNPSVVSLPLLGLPLCRDFSQWLPFAARHPAAFCFVLPVSVRPREGEDERGIERTVAEIHNNEKLERRMRRIVVPEM